MQLSDEGIAVRIEVGRRPLMNSTDQLLESWTKPGRSYVLIKFPPWGNSPRPTDTWRFRRLAQVIRLLNYSGFSASTCGYYRLL